MVLPPFVLLCVENDERGKKPYVETSCILNVDMQIEPRSEEEVRKRWVSGNRRFPVETEGWKVTGTETDSGCACARDWLWVLFSTCSISAVKIRFAEARRVMLLLVTRKLSAGLLVTG